MELKNKIQEILINDKFFSNLYNRYIDLNNNFGNNNYHILELKAKEENKDLSEKEKEIVEKDENELSILRKIFRLNLKELFENNK